MCLTLRWQRIRLYFRRQDSKVPATESKSLHLSAQLTKTFDSLTQSDYFAWLEQLWNLVNIMRMYVCIYIYIDWLIEKTHIYIYTYVYKYIHACTYIHMHTYAYTFTFTYTYNNIHICISTNLSLTKHRSSRPKPCLLFLVHRLEYDDLPGAVASAATWLSHDGVYQTWLIS